MFNLKSVCLFARTGHQLLVFGCRSLKRVNSWIHHVLGLASLNRHFSLGYADIAFFSGLSPLMLEAISMESERHSSSCKTNESTTEPPATLEVSFSPGNGNSARRTVQLEFALQIVVVGICGILSDGVFFLTYVINLHDTRNGAIKGVVGIGVIFVVAILVVLYLRMGKKTQVGDLENSEPPFTSLEPSSHFVGVVGTCGILVEVIFIWIFLTRFHNHEPSHGLILGLVLIGFVFPIAIFVLFFLRRRLSRTH